MIILPVSPPVCKFNISMAPTNFYSRNYTGWPPIHHRDVTDRESLYWRDRAEDAWYQLVKLVGQDAANEWSYQVWGTGRIQESWAGIYDAIAARLVALESSSCDEDTPDSRSCQNLEE